MTLREKLARAMAEAQDDYDDNDELVWMPYLGEADISIALVVEECARVADDEAAALRKLVRPASRYQPFAMLTSSQHGALLWSEKIAIAIRALAKPATEGEG